MSYNTRDYIRIKNEFDNKYRIAQQRAMERTVQLHAMIPDVYEIDKVLSHTGLDIMAVISSGVKDTDSEIARLKERNDELLQKRARLLRAYGFDEDYTDVKYDCERCADTGFVDSHMCDCMREALVKAGYESSGLGRLIGKQTFENFDLLYYPVEGGVRERIEFYANKLRSLAEGFNARTTENVLLIGGTGLGKTHLCTAVAQKVIERGYDVLYVSAGRMMSDFESNRFGNATPTGEENDIPRYYSCDLLIIDDLGTEVINKFTQSCLYEVINTRINTGKSTIINTNYTLTELNAHYTERIASRLLGEYQPCLFTGTDIRKQKSI